MRLADLLCEVALENAIVGGDTEIKGIKIDSRKVGTGDLYLAVVGTRLDGHGFIAQAVKSGAAAVVGSQPEAEFPELPVPYLQVADTRVALATLAAAWYGYPARELIVIGVTGTDGKTTTVNLIYQVLEAAGIRAGLISTVNARIGDRTLDTGFHVTTPEALDVQYYLSEMVRAGITHVVLEATSHGLAQGRVAACEFDIGVVTNITHEHLDYHGDYPHYLEAKSKLFRLVSRSRQKALAVNKLAVLNRDDRSFAELEGLVKELGLSSLTYALDRPADIQAQGINPGPDGTQFTILVDGREKVLETHLVGDYNVSNCLAAAGVCLAGLGLSLDTVQEGILRLGGIPGRMERIDLGQEFTVLVDFAHTPNALQRALLAGRELAAGRVIAVFGSAGLRDRQKRRLMAEVSAELADITILTAEDPRTEPLEGILEEMSRGAEELGLKEGRDYYRVADRGEAIRQAFRLAGEGDLVLVCGKGHEQSMCFGETEYPWDDRTAVRSALAELLGKEGPRMPYLPTQTNRPTED